MKYLIVPGVGGSEKEHWQTWLQHQLPNSIRVEQTDWYRPVLQIWVNRFIEVLESIQEPVHIIAHSFGCLTSINALAQRPDLAQQVSGLLLVASANPERFSSTGIRQANENSIDRYLPVKTVGVPTQLIASENDPWLTLADARKLASRWQANFINLGLAGHINVAAGFGPWPAIFNYLHPEKRAVNPFIPLARMCPKSPTHHLLFAH